MGANANTRSVRPMLFSFELMSDLPKTCPKLYSADRLDAVVVFVARSGVRRTMCRHRRRHTPPRCHCVSATIIVIESAVSGGTDPPQHAGHDAIAALARELMHPAHLRSQLAFELGTQQRASAVQADLDVGGGEPEALRRLLGIETFDLAQHEDGAQALRHPVDRALENAAELRGCDPVFG